MGVGLLLSLVSCSSDTSPEPFYTVGEADNPIRLSVGVGGSLHQATTRSTTYSALSKGTAITLRVDGKWTSKIPEEITQTTTATAAEPGSNTFNVLSLYPMLYWDDYGTADPANSANRAEGLTVYGVAVDGETSAPSIENNPWTSYPWPLSTNGSEVLKKDLLVGKIDHLKFDDRNPDTHRLELKHVLSKVTIQLKANNGFIDAKFQTTPSVVFSGNKGSETSKDYALTNGSVDLTTGIATSSGSPTTLQAVVTMSEDQSTATATALLYPNSKIAEADNAIVAKINADGNIFYIDAKALRTAIASNSNHKDVNSSTIYTTLPGFHYLITVNIDKSDIQVSATIVDWDKINAANETPRVNITVGAGSSEGSASLPSQFTLYYSTSKDKDFNDTQKQTVTKTESGWSIANAIYWPNHTTHYFIRGVAAATGTTQPSVELNGGNPYVAVSNETYDKDTHPSNLIMGKPIIKENDKMCGSIDHTPVDMEESGICARQGAIALTFQYVMSQVEVELKSDASTESQKVHLDMYTKVEIINGYTEGQAFLGTMAVETTGSKRDYTLDAVTGEDLKRHSIIVPQGLTNMRFKVTVFNSSNASQIDDVYYADIAPILKSGSTTEKVAPNGTWESGKHYVYTLNILKSGISAVATLQDWTKVESGDEEIWL